MPHSVISFLSYDFFSSRILVVLILQSLVSKYFILNFRRHTFSFSSQVHATLSKTYIIRDLILCMLLLIKIKPFSVLKLNL